MSKPDTIDEIREIDGYALSKSVIAALSAMVAEIIGEDYDIDFKPDGTKWLNRAIPRQLNKEKAAERQRAIDMGFTL